MSREGEGTEEASKFFVSENEGNTTALSGEVNMESVGSPEEVVKLNTPVPTLHIIHFSYSSPSFFHRY